MAAGGAILVATVACTTPQPVIPTVAQTLATVATPTPADTSTPPPTIQATAAATPTATASAPGVLQSVPREVTWILGGWEHASNLADADNFNPYTNLSSLRTNYAKFVYEALMVTNLVTGEEIPWLAEGYQIDADHSGMTIVLRQGVTWADGEPFTCADVAFSVSAVRDNDAARHHATFREWVAEVSCPDEFTVRIVYTGSNPRFYQQLMVGHENHFVIVPKHIFEGQDLATLTNLDWARGWPVGTGAYRLVLATSQQIVYDRRDDWWGAEIGFRPLPAPERIVVTAASGESMLADQYKVSNIDYGGYALTPAAFEVTRQRNPAVRSWNPKGPVYGAPDDCVYQLSLNNAKYSDRDVRLAMNYAIDRQAVVDRAFGGATYPQVLPVSGYVWNRWRTVFEPVIEAYGRDAPSQDQVSTHMAAAGYALNGDGWWEKDGEVLAISIIVPQPWAPLGPVLVEQLSQGGFQAERVVDSTGAWVPTLMRGEADAVAFVHCGSLIDPYDTLAHFHSRYRVPVGEMDNGGGIFTTHRYVGDVQLDLTLDEMSKTPPDDGDPGYARWVATAAELYLRDMPTIVLAEGRHIVAMNETYWTGYPTSEAPYLAPYPCWNDFSIVPFMIQPALQD